MKLGHMLLTAAVLAVAYIVVGRMVPFVASYLAVFAAALALVFLFGIFTSVAAAAANVARIRADLAQWLRDPKAADPEDSYLARLTRTLAPK